MTTNIGAWPIDATSIVGQLREVVGDIDGVQLPPPDESMAEFSYFSDSELDSLYSVAEQSFLRATGLAYRRLAVYLTLESTDIQSDDLRIRTIERAKAMRQIAQDFMADADADDERAGADIFMVSPYVRPESETRRPEAMPWSI